MLFVLMFRSCVSFRARFEVQRYSMVFPELPASLAKGLFRTEVEYNSSGLGKFRS